jgi:DNA repair protein RadC
VIDEHPRNAELFRKVRRERFHALCLSSRRVLLADVLVAEGMEDGCLVDPREVFSVALAVGASGVVLAHNHPSGNVKPSEDDIALTERAVKAGRLLGIWVGAASRLRLALSVRPASSVDSRCAW